MKPLSDILSFRPLRLPAARARLVELHPATRSRLRALAPPEVAALKARVAQAAGAHDPGGALRTLARSLLRHELVAVAGAIGEWEDLRDAVAMILRERPREDYVPVLWRKWQAFPRVDHIVDLVASMGERFGMRKAVPQRYADDAARWFRSVRPIDAVVIWTGDRRFACEELPEIPDSPFKSGTPLLERVLHRTLQIGSREQLLDMDEDTILEGWERMAGEELMVACANFLERIERALWSDRERTLKEVREHYGNPPGTGVRNASTVGPFEVLSAFWDRVSESRREDFRKYFIERELDLAFRGDLAPDRKDFWMKQRHDIVDVRHGKAGNTNWSLIGFAGFSVVEFFKYGNAAHLYPEDAPVIRRIRSDHRFEHPRELKRRETDRIIHRPGWQGRATAMLKEWKTRSS